MEILEFDLLIFPFGFLQILSYSHMPWVDHSYAGGRCIQITPDYTCEIGMDASDNPILRNQIMDGWMMDG